MIAVFFFFFFSFRSEVDIYLFGGCVTSWKVPNGKDLLFVRPDAVFNKKKPIRLLSFMHQLIYVFWNELCDCYTCLDLRIFV